jgi:hypothetical protein
MWPVRSALHKSGGLLAVSAVEIQNGGYIDVAQSPRSLFPAFHRTQKRPVRLCRHLVPGGDIAAFDIGARVFLDNERLHRIDVNLQNVFDKESATHLTRVHRCRWTLLSRVRSRPAARLVDPLHPQFLLMTLSWAGGVSLAQSFRRSYTGLLRNGWT